MYWRWDWNKKLIKLIWSENQRVRREIINSRTDNRKKNRQKRYSLQTKEVYKNKKLAKKENKKKLLKMSSR